MTQLNPTGTGQRAIESDQTLETETWPGGATGGGAGADAGRMERPGDARPREASLAKTKRSASPCAGVCALDEATGLCRGCQRTLAEIASWGSLSQAEREGIWLKIERRRDQPSES